MLTTIWLPLSSQRKSFLTPQLQDAGRQNNLCLLDWKVLFTFLETPRKGDKQLSGFQDCHICYEWRYQNCAVSDLQCWKQEPCKCRFCSRETEGNKQERNRGRQRPGQVYIEGSVCQNLGTVVRLRFCFCRVGESMLLVVKFHSVHFPERRCTWALKSYGSRVNSIQIWIADHQFLAVCPLINVFTLVSLIDQMEIVTEPTSAGCCEDEIRWYTWKPIHNVTDAPFTSYLPLALQFIPSTKIYCTPAPRQALGLQNWKGQSA